MGKGDLWCGMDCGGKGTQCRWKHGKGVHGAGGRTEESTMGGLQWKGHMEQEEWGEGMGAGECRVWGVHVMGMWKGACSAVGSARKKVCDAGERTEKEHMVQGGAWSKGHTEQGECRERV